MLETSALVAAYGEITALHGVTLSVTENAIVAILGSNGAGKTTLLKCLSGLLSPRSGEINFRGKNIAGLEAEKIVSLGISHVPEGRLIFPTLSVKDNLAMGGYLGTRRDVEKGIDRVCEYFPILKARMNQTGGTLSGGRRCGAPQAKHRAPGCCH